MSYTEIPVSKNSTYGTPLLFALQSLQNGINGISNLSAKANTMVDNAVSPANYAQVELQFGLTPQASGSTGTTSTGYSFIYQLNAMVTALQASAVTQALAEIG
jgi:hypothetical protein